MKKLVLFLSVLIFLFLVAGAENVSSPEENYINYFAEQHGISNITNVEKVNETDLPNQIDLTDVNDNQIQIYALTYTAEGLEKNLFVVSYSSTGISQPEEKVSFNQNYLSFSRNSKITEGYVSQTNYVMLNSGSITGLSTEAKIDGNGILTVEVRKNGVPLGIKNEITKDIDYDLESKNLDTFKSGDVISLYVKTTGGLTCESINSLVLVENE